MSERREYRQGRYVYLLDDNDHTAWIKQGHIGRCKTYRIPSSVNIEVVPYTITSVELGAYKRPRFFDICKKKVQIVVRTARFV